MTRLSSYLVTVTLSVFASVMAVVSASSEGHQGKWMGYIEKVGPGCLPDAYKIEPAGSAKYKHELYEKDKIVIRSVGCTLTIRYGNITKEINADFVVPSVETVSLLARVMDTFTFARSQEKIETRGHTRGDKGNPADEEVTFPLLQHRNNHMRAGTRTLYLAWRGGPAPFNVKVSVVGQKGKAVAQRDQLMSWEVAFESLNLPPGTYRVAVGSADGLLHQAYFAAVDAGDIPNPPAELLLTSEQDPPSALLQAIWLASEGNGEYAFEAYQQIADLAQAYPTAQLILEKLNLGWRPQL